MLCRFFPLSPDSDKKNTRPPIAAISKNITANASCTACCSNRASPSSIGATFASPPRTNFVDINGDPSPHCPLTQEFFPVPPTTFGDTDAAMFGDYAMKSAEAGAPLRYYNQKILASKNLFIQSAYLELYNHIPPTSLYLARLRVMFY